MVETSGSNAEHDGAKLEAFLEDAQGSGIVTDGTLAQDGSQAAAIWGLRESISEGLRHAGALQLPGSCRAAAADNEFLLGAPAGQQSARQADSSGCWALTALYTRLQHIGALVKTESIQLEHLASVISSRCYLHAVMTPALVLISWQAPKMGPV